MSDHEPPKTSPVSDGARPVLAYQTLEPRSTPRARGRARGEVSALIGLLSAIASFLLPMFRIAASLSVDTRAMAMMSALGLVAAIGAVASVSSIVLARSVTAWALVGFLLNGLALAVILEVVRVG